MFDKVVNMDALISWSFGIKVFVVILPSARIPA